MNTKKFSFISLGLTMVAFAIPTIVIDPYFHYHAPLENLEYPINNQRYQNDGMLKHFTYDAVIAGSSMTINFKPEEFDELFDVNSLQVSFLGGSYKEINNNVLTGLRYNPNVRIVLRGLDLSLLDKDKDYMKYELSYYPDYLYDSNIFNDVSYIFNKSVFDLNWEVLEYTEEMNSPNVKESEEVAAETYSKEKVLNSFERIDVSDVVEFTDEDRQRILDNVQQNITRTAGKYPDVTFYLFITPYNICYWDEVCRSGKLDYMLEAEKVAIEEMLQYENIRLFSFANNADLICNLDNYCDQGHYSPAINSKILKWMKNGEFELTEDNYEEYISQIKEFFEAYDYDSIYE